MDFRDIRIGLPRPVEDAASGAALDDIAKRYPDTLSRFSSASLN